MKSITIIFIFCLLNFGGASEEICKKITNCKCQHSKGTVDLSSIAGKEFSATLGGQKFFYFPCEQTTDVGSSCEVANDNAVCVQNKKSGNVLDWGAEVSVSFLVPNPVDYSVIIAKFESSDSKRKTQIYLACPKEGKGGQGLEVLDVQGDNAELRLTSNAACYKPNPPITTKPQTTVKPIHTSTDTSATTTPTSATFSINLKKLGHWYLLAGGLVLAFVCLILYLLIRLVVKYRKGVEGSRPLQGVCCDLCGLFVDGFLFVFSCFPLCRHAIGKGTSRGYEPIGIEEGNCNGINSLNNNHRFYNSVVNNNNNNNNNNTYNNNNNYNKYDPPKRSCCIL